MLFFLEISRLLRRGVEIRGRRFPKLLFHALPGPRICQHRSREGRIERLMTRQSVDERQEGLFVGGGKEANESFRFIVERSTRSEGGEVSEISCETGMKASSAIAFEWGLAI